jgi:hypothetical protein
MLIAAPTECFQFPEVPLPLRSPLSQLLPELEFLKSLWGLGTEEEEGYRTGPPGYIGWQN